MSSKAIKTFTILALMVMAFGASGANAQDLKTITMGTGGPSGVYYAVGHALADKLNPELAKLGYEIKVIATAGSAYNLQHIQQGKFELGISQSDVACRAWDGKGQWSEEGPQTSLRSIAGLQSEAVSLICAANSSIKSVADLKGKCVGIGAPGSGVRQNALDVLAIYGVKTDELACIDESLPKLAAEKLIRGDLDAFFITIGHPSELIYRLSNRPVPVRFVNIKTADAKKAGLPYYVEADFVKTFYPSIAFPEDFLPTMGVQAVLVAHKDLPAPVGKAISALLYGGWKSMARLNPALSGLNPRRMQAPLCAPLLPVTRQYIEANQIK